MLNQIVRFFIYNKPVTVLLLLLLTIWGLINSPFEHSFRFFPKNPVLVNAIPNLSDNQQIVYTTWKGHSPKEIDNLITYPLMSYLMGLPGVKTIRSSSMLGVSNLYIIFNEDIEFYWSRSRIIEKLNAIPKDLLPSSVNPSLGPDSTAMNQIFWYTLESNEKCSLEDLRSFQDYYVKPALMSVENVSEIASIGGYVKEFQIDVNPFILKNYKLSLTDVLRAVKNSNKEISAKTMEVNNVEYIVRGLGYVSSISDIENSVIKQNGLSSVLIKDVATVRTGPSSRRGVLDKNGIEAVGGVVVSRIGANPMKVINDIKTKIKKLSLNRIKLIPFYDQSTLIKESIQTLNKAIYLEVLITILVVLIMIRSLRASFTISLILPVVILSVFILMQFFSIEANIASLAGIAIAIGTIVDMGIIITDRIVKLQNNKKHNSLPTSKSVFLATSTVSKPILTASLTTIVSFLPVFALSGAEGKMFTPLAFTKTFALISALIISLFILPTIACFFLKRYKSPSLFFVYLILLIAICGVFYKVWLGFVLVLFVGLRLLTHFNFISKPLHKNISFAFSLIIILCLLSSFWQPLGVDYSFIKNLFFTVFICGSTLSLFLVFKRYYVICLTWALRNKIVFLLIPCFLILFGWMAFYSSKSDFMPTLNEGAFLLMPTSPPHTGITQNKRYLSLLDKAVSDIPEVHNVIGKLGRVESAFDPAPINMFECLVNYKPEYVSNEKGVPIKFKVTKDNFFICKNGSLVYNPNITDNSSSKSVSFSLINSDDLITSSKGRLFRNWRPHIKSRKDIWDEIVTKTDFAGLTSSSPLQPIETRLLMLQSGMRSSYGIKITGSNFKDIEYFSKQLETLLKTIPGVNTSSVFADQLVAKPYINISIDRDKLVNYGISLAKVQQAVQVALAGVPVSKFIKNRERYTIRVRYAKSFRENIEDLLTNIHVPIDSHNPIPLSEIAYLSYEKGSQAIKREDSFLINYVLFDKLPNYSSKEVINSIDKAIQKNISKRHTVIPADLSYEFDGTYKNIIHAEKTLSFILPITLLLIFMILYLQFKSISSCIMLISSILVSFSGGFVLLWLYSQNWFLNIPFLGTNLRDIFQVQPINLNLAVWVGFISLFGIASDDGVLMTTYIKEKLKNKSIKTTHSVRKHVIKAAKKRLRPCLITSITTIIALMPILTSSGKGKELMIPMAIPCVGGVFFTIITLFIIPVLHSWKAERNLKQT